MGFEIKYDKVGNVIPQPDVEQQIMQAADNMQPEQPVVQQEQLADETPRDNHQEPSREQAAQAVQQDNDAQTNMRRMRESKEKSDRERDEALRYAAELRSKYETPGRKQPDVYEEEDDLPIGNEDLAEGKHLKALNNKYKALQRQMKESDEKNAQERQAASQMATEAKLKSQYPDLDKVLSSSNIEQLKESYPELAHTINSSGNLYNMAVSAYTMIKKLGIHKDDTYAADKARVAANAAKPKAMNSMSPQQGDSPLANANAFQNGLTLELKQQLRAEMEEIRRNSY